MCSLIRRALWGPANADETEKLGFETEQDSETEKRGFEAKQDPERRRGFEVAQVPGRKCVFNKELDPEPDQHFELAPEEWERLMRLAARQGVLAVAWDGLSGSHNAAGLTKEQRIRWGLSVKQIEANHTYQRRALLNLTRLFEGNDIRLMLLKGLGLSENYPCPAHRECGDLDLYLWDDYEKGNHLIAARNIAVDTEGPKHSKFYWEGVPVENHLHFLNVQGTRTDRRLEQHLLQILDEQGTELIYLNHVPVRVPTPDFNALFLTRHAIVHFLASGMVLRNFCDLAMFFAGHFGRIDFERLRRTLTEEGQFDVFSSFLGIARRRLGMPAIPGLWTDHKEEITRRIWSDVLSMPSQRDRETYARMPVFRRKAIGGMRLLRSKWKYDLTGRGVFGERVFLSVKAML